MTYRHADCFKVPRPMVFKMPLRYIFYQAIILISYRFSLEGLKTKGVQMNDKFYISSQKYSIKITYS